MDHSKDIKVLRDIWSRSTGQNVFMPYTDSGFWHEGRPVDPNGNLPSEDMEVDQYFSPLRYNGNRKKGLVGNPGVIFADLDGGNSPILPIPPTIIIVSSQYHYHAYWYLDQPYTPQEWEPHAKGWTHLIEADPGGWDLTQVLRVPGTWNHKYESPFRVYVQQYEPSRIYTLSDFPTDSIIKTPDLPTPTPSQTWRDQLLLGDIPLSAAYWLTATANELKALGTIDRSKIMWSLELSLLQTGLTPVEVFQLVHHSAVNKHKAMPHRLWAEINKANVHHRAG